MTKIIEQFTCDRLEVEVYPDEIALGEAAAVFVTGKLNQAIAEKGNANLILATGTSQFAFLHALKNCTLDWSKITVFHLDEYKDISDEHPASFRKYLRERILNIVKPRMAYLIPGDAPNLEMEMERYETLLKQHPIDVACIGIGENGHIAFNDPPVADFNDPKWVKLAELDTACRKQQMGEGWFLTLSDVPTHAVTLTIPAIMASKTISCVVPGARKGRAIADTLLGPIETACPASILRRHGNTLLYTDKVAMLHFDEESTKNQ